MVNVKVYGMPYNKPSANCPNYLFLCYIIRYLKDSPSLKRYLTDEWLDETYVVASLNAQKETDLEFPVDCPYSIEDVLERPINLG